MHTVFFFLFAAAMRMSTFCISNLLLIWKIVIHQGKENPSEILPPQPYNICTIMYTSGTSGDPKGVVLTHETVTLFVRGVDLFMEQFEDKVGEKTYWELLFPCSGITWFIISWQHSSKSCDLDFDSCMVHTISHSEAFLMSQKQVLFFGYDNINQSKLSCRHLHNN